MNIRKHDAWRALGVPLVCPWMALGGLPPAGDKRASAAKNDDDDNDDDDHRCALYKSSSAEILLEGEAFFRSLTAQILGCCM